MKNIDDLSRAELIARVRELQTQLQKFYDPDFASSEEQLHLLSTAIMVFLDSTHYRELPIDQKRGYILRTLHSSLRELHRYLDQELYQK